MKLKIRQHREAKKLTQQDLGKAIGKSFRTIQSWEREDSYPNADMLWKLCEFFGTDPNEFMGWWDDHPRESPPALTRDESVLLSDYRECTPDRRRKAADAVRDQRQLSQGLESAGRSFDELMAQVKAGGDMPTDEEIRAAIEHDTRASMGEYEPSPIERLLNSCAEEGAA